MEENNEDRRLVLFIICNDPVMKKTVTNLLTANTPTLLINSEIIPSDADKDSNIRKESDLTKGQFESRRNSRIMEALVKEANQLFIVDLEKLTKDLIAQYSTVAKLSGCRLVSLIIADTSNSNGKHLIFLKTPEFNAFSKLFKRSTEQTKVISTKLAIEASEKEKQEKQRHIDFVQALNTETDLILINSAIISEKDTEYYTAFGTAFGFSILNIETGKVDLKNPEITMNGKPLKIKSQSQEHADVLKINLDENSSDTVKLTSKAAEFSLNLLIDKAWWGRGWERMRR